MRLDPFESRHDMLSSESKTAPVRLSCLGGVLLSKTSLRASFALLVFFLVLKQIKNAPVSMV